MLNAVNSYKSPFISPVITHLSNAPSSFSPTTLTKKIYEFCFPYFKSGSGFFFLGFGICETYHMLSDKKRLNLNTENKISPNYLGLHGTLLIGAGICTEVESLHSFSVINLGSILSKISSAGGVLFLLANFVGLQANINMYEQGQNIDCTTSEKNRQIAYWMCRSAVTGILSNLGYIIATAIALFGASTAIAVLIGIISSCFGGIKILFDLVAWMKG
jgi:hypothetical protein